MGTSTDTDWDCDDGERVGRCERCGGDGFIEYDDAEETWGEDCPSEVNHLVTCPTCGGDGAWKAASEERRP